MTNTNKEEEAGKKMRSVGKQLTGLAILPILLTIFLGIPGLIVGGVISLAAYVYLAKKGHKS
jgi:hypothetical protein